MKKKLKLLSNDFTNLRKKTIFDFCEDKEWLDEECAIDIADKESWVKELSNNPAANMNTLYDFAEAIKNKEFMRSIKKQFKKEWDFQYNE